MRYAGVDTFAQEKCNIWVVYYDIIDIMGDSASCERKEWTRGKVYGSWRVHDETLEKKYQYSEACVFFKRGYLDFEQNLQQKVFFSDSRANKEPFTNIRFGLLFSRQHRAVALHHQDWKADMKNAGKKAESLVRHFLFTHGSQQ